jgi:hypothetical protein
VHEHADVSYPLALLRLRRERPRSRCAWLHEIKHDGFRIIARKECPGCGSIVVQATTSPAASR